MEAGRMNWREFLKPEKRRVFVFLFIVFILVLRGVHWLVEGIDLIWVPLLLISTVILLPVGLVFKSVSSVAQISNGTAPIPNDLLVLIYPGLVLYSYLLACAVTYMTTRMRMAG